MTDHAFRRLEFDSHQNFKPHFVPELLIQEIRSDITGRVGSLKSQSHVRIGYGDLGGATIQGEPIATFTIGEHLRFSTLARHAPALAVLARDARIRGETDKHVKIHFHLCCLVLTLQQREDLLASIKRTTKTHDRRFGDFVAAHSDWLDKHRAAGIAWPDYARQRKVISAQTYAHMKAAR